LPSIVKNSPAPTAKLPSASQRPEQVAERIRPLAAEQQTAAPISGRRVQAR